MPETRSEQPRKGCIGVISIDHSDASVVYLMAQWWAPAACGNCGQARVEVVRCHATPTDTGRQSPQGGRYPPRQKP